VYAAYLYALSNGGNPPTPTSTPLPTFTTEPPTPTATFTLEPPTPTATYTPEPPTATATFTAEPPTPTATAEALTNLALGRPVTVSSYLDTAHSGSMAVDGNLGTGWQTKRNSKLSTEWLQVDLGAVLPISQVVLRWDIKYPTSYNVQISQNNQSWTALYSTISGDGGIDSISFNNVEARYIKMVSSAWLDKTQRCWLFEFEVLGSEILPPADGTTTPAPSPTNTSPPPPPPTSTPTATASSSNSLHIGDLDGFSNPNSNRWDAHVQITAHTVDEIPIDNATITGTWSGGVSGNGTCITDSLGKCSVSMISIRGNLNSVTFTVTSADHSTLLYDPALNHDPDGDSSGTTITIAKP
jgi:hypothetical protein